MESSIKRKGEKASKENLGSTFETDFVSFRPKAAEGEDSSGAPRTQPVMTTTDSLIIDRVLARLPLPKWSFVLAIGLTLFVVPLVLCYLDGISFSDVLSTYRAPFVYALTVVYMLLVFDGLQKTRQGVADGLRPLIPIDDVAYASLVQRGCRVPPVGELSALAVGLVISVAINVFLEPIAPGTYAIDRYAYLSRIAVMSLDIWFLSVVFAMTRLTNTLLHQPIDVDLFDLAPFEPIGSQSVWLCLTIVGSLLLGLMTLDAFNWSLLQEYVVYSFIVIFAIIVVFFVNTHKVHRVIAAMKKQRLATVKTHLARATVRLESLIVTDQGAQAVATEINALAIVKRELTLTRTWPYNTEMLRTLAISILTPFLLGLARVAIVLLAS